MKAFQARHYLLGVTLREGREAGHDGYPFSIPAVRDVKALEFHPAVTFLIGENGSGKSTIAEALAVLMGFNPEGGTTNFRFATRDSHSDLASFLRPVRAPRRPRTGFFLRAESYFNVASEIEHLDDDPGGGPPVIHSYGGRSLHEQSHGESFMALMLNRFGPEGLYILDEPEAALSPVRQMSMIARLHELIEQGSQFIIATHSPIIMAYPNAAIYELSQAGLARIAYEETEHYRITLDFLRNYRKRLATLMEDADADTDAVDDPDDPPETGTGR